MAWGNKTLIANGLSVAGTELFSDDVSLNPGEQAHIEVKGNSDGTTDSLIISVYTTLDDTSEEWSTVPIFSKVLDCTDGGDNICPIIVSDVYKFRLGFVRNGSTDTIDTDANVRLDGANI
jgi:hypothetical protein